MLENIISKIFLEHQYILESTSVSEFDKEIFSSIARRKAFRKNFVFPLLLLSKALKNHCCKNIIILIDKYDSPINHTCKYNYYDDIILLVF